ncbi:baseplate assembly protein [Leptospira langatensis]|nr:baseplate assembly protein [Leptospira langatensis]
MTESGEPFAKVRYFGPNLNAKTNTAHGRLEPLKKGQIVLVEFLFGSFRKPIISRAFPFAAKDSDLSNIQNFWDKYSFINPETDIIDFHESGYFVRQTANKIMICDSDQNVVHEIDFITRKAKWNIDIEVEGNFKVIGNTTFEGDLTQTGDQSITGKIHASKEISSDEDVKAGEISLTQHGHLEHPGPSPETRTAGGAVP